MNKLRLAIPMNGKMSVRTFHSPQFRKALEQKGNFELFYFVDPYYFQSSGLNASHYFPLKIEEYNNFLQRNGLIQSLGEFRRFVVQTETTDLRFRDSIEDRLFVPGSVAHTWIYAAFIDIMRHLPIAFGQLAAWYESVVAQSSSHQEILQREALNCVLVPGIGSSGFWYEGLFAQEAQRTGLKAFSAITNYDNLVNRGFRSFMPDRLAVWSQQMADEAIQLQRIPANRIEITGPVQYDRYFLPLSTNRDVFLKTRGLDPAQKTIFFAGGVNITRYFEIYSLLLAPNRKHQHPHNLVFRPYPHSKLLNSPGWKALEMLLTETEKVYISDPFTASSDNLQMADIRRDLLEHEQEIDELHGLLKFSDVMINTFSTISLEAAICDLPTIHLGYDAYTFGHRYNMTTAFQQRQTHNCRKLRLAAAKVVRDEDELLEYTELYLTDRNRDREVRYDYALSECGYLDGQSSNRLAEMIKAFVA